MPIKVTKKVAKKYHWESGWWPNQYTWIMLTCLFGAAWTYTLFLYYGLEGDSHYPVAVFFFALFGIGAIVAAWLDHKHRHSR